MLPNVSSVAVIFWFCNLGVLGITARILGSLLEPIMPSWPISDLIIKNLEEPLSHNHVHRHFKKRLVFLHESPILCHREEGMRQVEETKIHIHFPSIA